MLVIIILLMEKKGIVVLAVVIKLFAIQVKMDLENKTTPEIVGYTLISLEEFYELGKNKGLRLFDYSNECIQYCYKLSQKDTKVKRS